MESDNKHQPDSIENQSPEIPEPENTTEYYCSDLKNAKKLYKQTKDNNRLTLGSFLMPPLLGIGVCFITFSFFVATTTMIMVPDFFATGFLAAVISFLVLGFVAVSLAIILLQKEQPTHQEKNNSSEIIKSIAIDFAIVLPLVAISSILVLFDGWCGSSSCLTSPGILTIIGALLSALGVEIILFRSAKFINRTVHYIDFIWFPIIAITIFLIRLYLYYN